MSARHKIAVFLVGGTLLAILFSALAVAWVLTRGPVSDVVIR
jgi:hypothetical protein